MQDTAPGVAVYLVGHDGHTGIGVSARGPPRRTLAESRDFPQADYLEVGWGNRDYYYGRNQDCRER